MEQWDPSGSHSSTCQTALCPLSKTCSLLQLAYVTIRAARLTGSASTLVSLSLSTENQSLAARWQHAYSVIRSSVCPLAWRLHPSSLFKRSVPEAEVVVMVVITRTTVLYRPCLFIVLTAKLLGCVLHSQYSQKQYYSDFFFSVEEHQK